MLPEPRHAMPLKRMARQSDALRLPDHAVLEAFGTGAIVLDQEGLLVFANRAAHSLMQRGPLRLVPALDRRRPGQPALRLDGPTPAATARLNALAGIAARGGPGGAMRLFGAGDGALRILITPLPDVMDDAAGSGRALLLVEDMRAVRALPFDALQALYAFTRAETAVAEALLAGQTAEQIAAARQVGVPTIRSQVRAILDKTGARSVRDLGRFIAAP